MFFWGFGQGIFWLTVNTFELSETRDEERDFYASALNAGTQILGLAGPACATILIWLSGTVLQLSTYTLLFTVTPAIYLFGFFCFSSIRDYRPPHIRWLDIIHYLTDRRNQIAQLYTFGTGFQQILGSTIPPLVIFSILGTAFKVGIYDTFFRYFLGYLYPYHCSLSNAREPYSYLWCYDTRYCTRNSMARICVHFSCTYSLYCH